MGSDVAEIDPLIIWTLTQLARKQESYSHCALLYCTAPLRTHNDIINAHDLLSKGYDCSLTLSENHDYLWRQEKDGSYTPTNYDPKLRAARQTENWCQFSENKAVYWFSTSDIMKTGCRINGKVGAYIMPALRSIDIDSLDEFLIAENIYKMK